MAALRLLSIGLLAGAAMAMAACAGGSSTPAPVHPAVAREAARTTTLGSPAVPTSAVARPRRRRTSHLSLAQRLSTRQLAGQRIVYAYTGLQPPASLVAAVRAGEAGGVIFFGPNISSGGQLAGVINQLQRASLASPVHRRLLMLVDQEGGAVRRLPGPPTLSEKQIGQSSSAASLAGSAGAGAGANLHAIGINVNLAPVLDVYRRAGNFIDQFQRSYSSHADTVARLGRAFIAAQQRTGVAATAKHFPGLGSATLSQDTDRRPAILSSTLSTLRTVDEAPYRGAIAAGVKLVMASWAIYPALDPRRPAGMSAAVLQGELRRRLGFRGVTITDGIDAGAATRFGTLGRRAVLAASAGADLILCATTDPNNNTPAEGMAARDAIASALAHRQISQAGAQQSASRILALRAGL